MESWNHSIMRFAKSPDILNRHCKPENLFSDRPTGREDSIYTLSKSTDFVKV